MHTSDKGETKHTPTPWRWEELGEPAYGLSQKVIQGQAITGGNWQGFAHTCGLGEPTDTANADFIILACNYHETLVEFVRGCVDDDCHGEAARELLASIAAAERSGGE